MALTAVGASAADLPQASVISGLVGDYMCAEWSADNIDVQFLNGEEAETISFANPLTGTSEEYNWETGEMDEISYEYINVTLNTPSGTETIEARINSGDYGTGWSATRAGQDSGTILSFQLADNYDIEWVKGDYSITLPAGAVENADGETNVAQDIDFKVVTSYVYLPPTAFNPLAQDYDTNVSGLYSAEALKAVTLTFDDEIVKNYGDVTYSDANYNDGTLANTNVTIDGQKLILDLSGLAEGTYSFEIPSGFVVIGGAAINATISFTYTIWNGLPEGQLIQGPASIGQFVNNIELYYGTDIEFANDGPTAIEVYEDWYSEYSEPAFTIPADAISIQEIPYSEGNDEPSTEPGEGSDVKTIQVLYLDIIESFIGKTGKYIIVIPQDYVTDGTDTNPLQTIEFTLANPISDEPVITISDEAVVSITWESVIYVGRTPGLTSYLIYPDGTREALSWYDWVLDNGQISMNDNSDGVDIDLSDLVTENGDYEVVIPEGFFSLETEEDWGLINNEIVYTFTYENGEYSAIRAIESVDAKAVMTGVYNLQGVRVANSSANINNLPAGLYIIDGKKVLIRK